MRLAIMQPYFFPYIGYFQLLAKVQRFVCLDDVAYIRRGWINRNRILLGGEAHYLTVPVAYDVRDAPIDSIKLFDQAQGRIDAMNRLRSAYRRAPHQRAVCDLVDDVLERPASSIGELARRSVEAIARLLDIDTAIIPTSRHYPNRALAAQDRIIDIARIEKATCYVNLPGGRALYQPDQFDRQGIALEFIEPSLRPYPQEAATGFVPALSIIDVLMWNDPKLVSSWIHDDARAA